MIMDDLLLLRLRVEELLYREADLLDRWLLDDWLALYTSMATPPIPTPRCSMSWTTASACASG
jgi:p-cumate 2,3-dioxygenase beta subunit